MEPLIIPVTNVKTLSIYPCDDDRLGILGIIEIKDNRNYMQSFVNKDMAEKIINQLKLQFGL